MIVIVSTKEPYKTINFDYAELKSVADTFISKEILNLADNYEIEFIKRNLMVSPILNMKHFYCYKYVVMNKTNLSANLSLYVMFDEGDDDIDLFVGGAGKQTAIRINRLREILDIENVKSLFGNPSHRFVYTYNK